MSNPRAFVFPDNPAALAASRELGAAGVRITLPSANRQLAAFSRFTDFVKTPDLYTDPEAWSDAMVELGRNEETPPVLFPTEDAALLAVEYYWEKFEGVFRIPYPGGDVIERILDKRRLYEACDGMDIDLPRHQEIEDSNQVAGLRAAGWLVKPACRYQFTPEGIRSFRQEVGPSKIAAGLPEEAAASVLGAGFPAMLQEAIPGGQEELVTAAVYLNQQGRIVDHFVARKRYSYPEPFGDGLIVRIAPDPGVVQKAGDLLRKMGYWGICDMEFKRDRRDGRFKLLDANPRTWLWMGLGTRSGTHLLLHAYNEAAGTRVKPKLRAPLRPPQWVSPKGALGFLVSCYRPHKHGLLLPARLLAGAARTTLGDWKAFRDPLYLRPSAWPKVLSTAFAFGSAGVDMSEPEPAPAEEKKA